MNFSGDSDGLVTEEKQRYDINICTSQYWACLKFSPHVVKSSCASDHMRVRCVHTF